MDTLHAIAARRAVLKAAEEGVADGSIPGDHPVALAVTTMRRAEQFVPMYTCAECGTGVIVRVEGGESKTLRGCAHVDAAILARGRARGHLVATTKAG